jgi:tRNA threonylcarbamoyladenosine modification (KEOPS) complex Cgi121 subunit
MIENIKNINDISKLINDIIILRCSSNSEINNIVDTINSDMFECVQVLDPNAVINSTHLIGAYANAINAFNEHTNISKKLNVEFILFAAMKREINKAIEKIGVKSSKDFVLFATEKDYNKKELKILIDKSKKFIKTEKEQINAAKLYGIDNASKDIKDFNKFVLQKIALSRLSEK